MTNPETEVSALTDISAEPESKYSKAELICVFISYITGRAYSHGLTRDLIIVFAGVVLMTVIINRGRRLLTENYVWLLCFALSTAGMVFCHAGIGLPVGVWDFDQLALFVHVFAVWFAFSASGKMYAGESSSYAAMDALNAFVIFPFKFIFRRITVLADAVKTLFAKKERKARNYYFIPALLICLVLFFSAADLLGQADSSFGSVLDRIRELFRLDLHLDEITVLETVLSIPVGAYLFGLIVGSTKISEEALASAKTDADGIMAKLKRIPVRFWTAVICMFSILYLIFFGLQFRYLFGAFTRTLPAGFIVSQYAREGFFELCKVMAVNFALLFTVTRMSSDDAYGNRLLRAGCLAILGESLVFALIAFSKLALYIDCFGFTPLRIQSSWLVCVLFAGCVLWMINFLKGRKTFKLWMMISALSLSALCIL